MKAKDLPNWTYVSIPALRKVTLQAFRTGTGFMTCIDYLGNTHYIPDTTEVLPITGTMFKMLEAKTYQLDKDYDEEIQAIGEGVGDEATPLIPTEVEGTS